MKNIKQILSQYESEIFQCILHVLLRHVLSIYNNTHHICKPVWFIQPMMGDDGWTCGNDALSDDMDISIIKIKKTAIFLIDK